VGGDGLIGRMARYELDGHQTRANVFAADKTLIKVDRQAPARAAGEGLKGLGQLPLIVQVRQAYPGELADKVVAVNDVRHGPLILGGAKTSVNSVLTLPVLSSATMGSVRRSGWRQYLPYLILNVILSALTMLGVLLIWGRGQPVPEIPPTSTMDAMSVAASLVPTKTPTIVPTLTPVTYTVRSGDTMGDIAVELGISIDALMKANNLSDPNTLSAGQVLIVPVTPGAASAATPSPVEAGATAKPTAAQDLPAVDIRGVTGAGNLETEAVRLLNSGGVADLAGWTLDDGQGHAYTFPAFTLHDGAVSIHTRAGTDTVIDLYWGLTEAVWLPGKTITLRDNSGKVRSTFEIPVN
jgi:LysM repeat protein